MPRFRVLSVLLVIGCASESIEPVEPRFSRTNVHGVTAHDLGPGTATDINVHGDVVGYAEVGESIVPWVQGLGGARRLLPLPPAPLPPQLFSCSTVAMAVNDRREIAGSIQCGRPPTVESSAVLWSAAGEITVLGSIGEVTVPNAINNGGMVVGTSIMEAPGFSTGAWYWTAQTGMQRVLSLGLNSEGTGAAVNQSGQIAGTQWTLPSPLMRAYTWSPKPADQALVVAPDGESRGYAIDARGRVGGASGGSPAISNLNDGWSLLPDLGFGGVVSGMSSGGAAVGSVGTASGISAAYWSVRGELVVLEPLAGFEASSAVAVNQRGWVVGHSWNATPYESRATLWTVDAPLPGNIARAARRSAPAAGAAQPFAVTAECTEKWRHFVQSGGACPEEWRAPLRNAGG